MNHSEIVQLIEAKAPLKYQESYDNSGWQVGDPDADCSGVLINLDVTESLVDEAIKIGSNLIIVHHPLIFGGVKTLIGKNYVERIIIKAIQNNISIYACHTNMDNMYEGVNHKIASKLKLEQLQILEPKQQVLQQLNVYVPKEKAAAFTNALFAAGAGHIGNYSECAFTSEGIGSFRPGNDTNPTIGQKGGTRENVIEEKVSVILPIHLQSQILSAMKAAHPYEEVAYELISIENRHQGIGAGIVGVLPNGLSKKAFLDYVKTSLKAEVIRYTDSNKKKISKIAICGGSGSFLLKRAQSMGCDAFITADFKYHQFFDGENEIMITDIGHYESEQFTSEIFYDIIKDNLPNFAVRISKINTNPVKYYF